MTKPQRPDSKRPKKQPIAAPAHFRLTPRTLTLIYCLALAAAVAAVYAQVHSFDFFSDDDPFYVVSNPGVNHGLSWPGLGWALTTDWFGNWQPLAWISYQVDDQLWGLNPGAFHLTNVLFHIANSILLFLALQRLTGAQGRSALVAALFALHPVHVESVAWIAERKDVVSGFFWMLALLAYARYVEKPSLARYLLVGAFIVLDFLSKAMSVTLPLVLLLLDFWPLARTPWNADSPARRSWRDLLLEKLPFIALSIIPAVLIFRAQAGYKAVAQLSIIPFSLRIENCFVSYVRYLGLFFFPHHLSYLYPYPFWKPVAVIGAIIILAAITVFVTRRIKTEPWLFVGWFWFFGVMFPVNGLVQVGEHAMNDHYTYLPSIGLGIIAAWGGYDLLKKFPRWVAPSLAAAALILCAVLTARQVSYWKNGIVLYHRVLAVDDFSPFADHYIAWGLADQGHDDIALAGGPPGTEKTADLDLIYAQIGNIYLVERNDIPNAIEALEKSERLQPDNAEVHSNLGVAYAGLGRDDDARAESETALRLKPSLEMPHYNLGNLLVRHHQLEAAIEEYRLAEKLEPDAIPPHNNLGSALYQLGHLDEAEAEFRLALQRDPTLVEARFNLGNILLRKNDFAGALDLFTSLIKDQPNDPEAHFDRALALTKLGRLQEAEAEYRKVLEVNPDSAAACNGLGNILGRENKPAEAVDSFQQAIRLKPDFAAAHYNLAVALKSLGRTDDAQKEFTLAHSLDPHFPAP